jgi:hypothetical protein
VSGPWAALKPYLEKESLAAFFVGVSSGFPYAMIGATLTTRLAQDGIDKKTITAFTLAFLVYNLKVFWAWIVDGVRIPLLGRLGQRVSWLLLAGVAVIAAVVNLAFVDPTASIRATVIAAVLVGIAGATYDIVIDAYRIETLKPYQLGVGSGMSQYGWRIGSAAAGALALVVAGRMGWAAGFGSATPSVVPPDEDALQLLLVTRLVGDDVLQLDTQPDLPRFIRLLDAPRIALDRLDLRLQRELQHLTVVRRDPHRRRFRRRHAAQRNDLVREELRVVQLVGDLLLQEARQLDPMRPLNQVREQQIGDDRGILVREVGVESVDELGAVVVRHSDLRWVGLENVSA